MDIKEKKWNEFYSAAQGELHTAQILQGNLYLLSLQDLQARLRSMKHRRVF